MSIEVDQPLRQRLVSVKHNSFAVPGGLADAVAARPFRFHHHVAACRLEAVIRAP